MSDLFRRGAAMVKRVQGESGSTTVTFARVSTGSDNGSVTVPATLGRQVFRLEENQRLRIEWSDMDFLVECALLVIGGNTITPRRGDRVTVADTDSPLNGAIYEVDAPPGEPPQRTSDNHGYRWRIHAKRVS